MQNTGRAAEEDEKQSKAFQTLSFEHRGGHENVFKRVIVSSCYVLTHKCAKEEEKKRLK